MSAAVEPRDEQSRLSALHALGVLDTAPEERFDRITRVAAAVFDVPIALISLVDAKRAWFKSCLGLPDREAPRGDAFCAHAILGSSTLVIPDTAADERFADNPLVTGQPGIRFYAGRPLRGPGGEALGTLCVLDRRPREVGPAQLGVLDDLAKMAEAELTAVALGELAVRLETVFHHLAEGIVTFGEDGIVRSANPAAAKVFARATEDVVGGPVDALLEGVTWSEASGRLETPGVLGTRRLLKGCRGDGTTFPLELVITRARIGRETLFIGIGQDVAARTAYEEALRESEQRLRAIFDGSPIGMSLVDLDGRAVQFNTAFADLLREQPGDLVGAMLHDRVHPDDRDLRTLAELLSGRRPVWRGERRMRRRDESYVWTEITTSVLRDANGAARFLLSNYVDITERKEVDRLKDEFVSVVGHELRTPLTSIRGSLGLVTGGVLGDIPHDAAKLLRVAVQNAERLGRLIEDILDVERMRSGRAPLERRAVGARELVDATLSVVEPLAQRAGVRVQAQVAEATVEADADRIVQALTNLAGNAVKFSPPDGVVTLRVELDGDELRFAVGDQGRGIPADKLERIFERFMQVDASDARERGGTGLGLAIARAIAEQHGGRIWAESQVGRGSTFTLALPLGAGG